MTVREEERLNVGNGMSYERGCENNCFLSWIFYFWL